MNKLVLTLVFLGIYIAAFGQGKVTFGNDGNHLIVVRNDPGWLSLAGKNSALAGLPAPQVGTFYNVMSNLTAQLWAGTSPDSLSLQATITPAGLAGLPDGRLRLAAVTLNGIPAGNAFFKILIFETSAGSYVNAWQGFGYWIAETPIFQARTGSFAPQPLVNSTNWTPGPIMLSVSLDHLPPPPPVLRSAVPFGNQFRFSFVARAYRSYTVEYCDSLAGNWTTLTNLPARITDGSILVADTMIAGERYFRVRTPRTP